MPLGCKATKMPENGSKIAKLANIFFQTKFRANIFKTVLSPFFLMFSVQSLTKEHKKAIENRTPV